MGRQHQGVDRPGVHQVPEGSGEQGKMEETGCKIISSAPRTLALKGSITMMTVFRADRDVCSVVLRAHSRQHIESVRVYIVIFCIACGLGPTELCVLFCVIIHNLGLMELFTSLFYAGRAHCKQHVGDSCGCCYLLHFT